MGNKPEVKQDPKELAKEQKRILTRAERKIEREQKKMEQQEAKTLKEIKALAIKGQHSSAKILSKQLV